MPRALYRLKQNNGSSHYITIPTELLVALGMMDMQGNIQKNCIRYDLGQDDEGTFGIIRPAYD
jgi:hypothetical protein